MSPLPSGYVAPPRDRRDEGKSSPVRQGMVPFDVQNMGVRQPDLISCGVACFATIARILGRDDLTFLKLTEILNPRPGIGTEQEDILKLARKEFKGVTGGENTYPGGLAIASITHFETRPQGSGHYWVLLGVEKGVAAYYCPYLNERREVKVADIVWKNGDGTYQQWSVNFPAPFAVGKKIK